MPPARYRSARIIDRACELMQKGLNSNKLIAQELGFSDEHHFSRRFKAITGCPPSVFRKRITYVP
jgi:AraC-like DNA-binding protein